MNKYAISAAKLRKLERFLYDRAMDGDTRLGLYLLKLYYKDLKQCGTGDNDDSPAGVIVLPLTAADVGGA